jgi:hypothetical protein
LVKVIKYCFDLKNILLILVFFVLIIFINLNINNSFPDDLSKSNLNSNKLNQTTITNQSSTNSKLYELNNNFFYLKTNGLSVPINFFTEEKNILNNVIYEKDRKSLILILNPLNLNNNSIIIQIPRSILDSKTSDNKDNRFEVLVDDKPSKFLEITPTNDSNSTTHNKTINSFLNDIPNRELSIGFEKDTKVIKISGADLSTTQKQNQKQTHPQTDWLNIIIPIVSLSLAVLLVIIIFFYKKGKLSFMNSLNIKRKEQKK